MFLRSEERGIFYGFIYQRMLENTLPKSWGIRIIRNWNNLHIFWTISASMSFVSWECPFASLLIVCAYKQKITQGRNKFPLSQFSELYCVSLMFAELSFHSLFTANIYSCPIYRDELIAISILLSRHFVHYALQINIQFKEKWDSLAYNTIQSIN